MPKSNYKKTDTMCPLKCVNSTSYTDCNLISVSHKVRSFGPLLKYENIFNSLIMNYTMFLNKLSNIIMIYLVLYLVLLVLYLVLFGIWLSLTISLTKSSKVCAPKSPAPLFLTDTSLFSTSLSPITNI